jgi:CRP-like cAMP-binding protein
MKTINVAINQIVESRYPDMSMDGRDLLANLLVKRELKKGERLFNEGDICKDLVLVGEGMLRQFYFKNDHDVTEHFSYEGSVLFCIESFLNHEPTHLMAEALEPSVVYLLSSDVLNRQIVQSWEINTFYRKVLEYSLIQSQQKADSLRFETASERYNNLMSKQPEVIMRAPMSCIASYLLMTPETLSRVRAQISGKS